MATAKIKLRSLPPVARPATKAVYVNDAVRDKPEAGKTKAGEIELLDSEDLQDDDEMMETEEIEEMAEEEETAEDMEG